MDIVTQSVLGAAIGEAGFRKELGSKAIIFGACCGLFPDMDMLTELAGPWITLKYHRSLSHSLLFLLFIAPVVAWLGHLWTKRQQRYKTWLLLSFLTLLTHPLLDFCTSYGTLLFYPLSHKRFAVDAIAIVDLFYTIPLIVVLIVGV